MDPLAAPRNPNFEAEVRENFARQRAMRALGASLEAISPGRVSLGMPYQEAFTQQRGFLHAGTSATLLDSACGYAALSLMPAGADVLSVEFKLNLLAPASGERFVARAEVRRAGRSITVCQGELFALTAGAEKLVALMQATMMTVLPEAA